MSEVTVIHFFIAESLNLTNVFDTLIKFIEGNVRSCDIMKIVTDGNGDMRCVASLSIVFCLRD